jgi:hypothetical protein
VIRAPGSTTQLPNCADTGAGSCWWRFTYMGRASDTDIHKTAIAAVEEAAMIIVSSQEEVMNNQVLKYVTQAKASFLLGIPETEFRRISKESGLGRVERVDNEEETYFTYEELQRIRMHAAHQLQAVR